MDLSEINDSLFPKTAFTVFGLNVNESAVSGFFVTVFLIIVAVIIRIFFIPKMSDVPGKMQMFLEWIVGLFMGMSEDMTDYKRNFLASYTFGASAYICFGVLIELVGLRPAIADVNACLALALCTFLLINILSIKRLGGFGRVKYYFKPVWYVFPIRIITDLAVPVSMTFRLFGSIVSGFIMMELIYMFCGWVLPVVLTPVFTLFHALIQSYIFSALSLTFVAEATEVD